MVSRQQSEDTTSRNRFTFRLSPPNLPHLSLRRIFTPSSSSNGKSSQSSNAPSWRNRLRILTNAEQSNDGTRSEGGASQYSAPSSDTRSMSAVKAQSKASTKLPVANAITRTHSNRSSSSNHKQECSMCFQAYTDETSRALTNCEHKFCLECLTRYISTEVSEGRANLGCPEPACQSKLHPSDVGAVVGLKSSMYRKYEEFLLRRCLMADPDTRWCPAPDCGFAVIAAGCAECPQLRCERGGCGTSFCYHCKQIWHPNLTCEVARVRRSPHTEFSAVSSDHVNKEDIKACPRCGVFILKADDGSCNHMSCRLCGAEFCWLCMKLVTDVHYLSPSGCTFWGKKRWSRKKKLFWQLGLLAGAPVGIVLLTAIAIPAIMAGFPIWTGRKIRQKHRNTPTAARNAAIAGGVIGATLAAPAIAAAAVGVGVPVLLAYVYGVVPVSLCRSGSVGAKESKSNSDNADRRATADVEAIMAAMNNPSSPMVSGDHTQIMLYPDKASNVAMAGTLSIASVEAVISGELNSQAEPDPGSWHLSVDTAGGAESDGHDGVTVDSFTARHLVLCDKPLRCDDGPATTSLDCASVVEPSLAGSIGSSLAARRVVVRSTRGGTSASTESIGASYGCQSEDHFSGVCPDSASASVRGLTGSVSKLNANGTQQHSSSSALKITSSVTPRPQAESPLLDPVLVDPTCQTIVSTCDCEIVLHDPPSSS